MLILIIILFAVYGGMKRGLLTQLVALLGYTISFYLALRYHSSLSEYLELIIPYPSSTLSDDFLYFSGEETFNLDQSFYLIVSFLAIILLGYIVVRLIVFSIQPFVSVPDVYPAVNKVGGAVISALIAYVFIFIVLYIATTLPMAFVQNGLTNSGLAQFMIEHTPLLSDMFYNLMIQGIM